MAQKYLRINDLNDIIICKSSNKIKILFFFFLQNPMAQIEEEKREHHNKMLKMEREMEEVIS